MIITKDSAKNFIAVPGGKVPPESFIDSFVALMVIDEFHSIKTANPTPYDLARKLRGSPTLLGVSASPWEKPGKTYALNLASHGQHSTVDDKPPTLQLRAGEFSGSVKVRFKDESYRGMHKTVLKIDGWLKSNSVARADDNASEDGGEISARTIPDDVDAAITKFATHVAPQMIKFDADLLWQPDPSIEGMPAIEMPPHAAFDIDSIIPSKHKDAIGRMWQKLKTAEQGELFPLVKTLRVAMLFSCLYAMKQQDTYLHYELGKFTTDSVNRVTQLGRNSHTWEKVMPALHKGNSAELLRHMITQKRKASNELGFASKVVIVAYKPFNAAIA